jgi:hypothetical protein
MKKEIIKFLFFFPFSYRGMKMEKNEKIPVWYRGMKISGMKKEHAFSFHCSAFPFPFFINFFFFFYFIKAHRTCL